MKSSYVWCSLAALGALAFGCSSSDTGGGSGQGGASSSTTVTSTATGTGGEAPAATTTSTSTGMPAECEGCVVLASLPLDSGPYDLRVDDTNVYWSNSLSGEIMSAAKDGSGDPVTMATGQGDPWGVDIDADYVYWVMYDVSGVLRKIPKAGGTVIDVVAAPVARHVAVSAQYAWWTREPDDIHRVDLDGMNEFLMISANILSHQVKVDAERVYWVNPGDGRVRSSDYGGLDALDLVVDQGEPWGVAVDDANIFWTNRKDGRVQRASKADGNSIVELYAGAEGPKGIWLDETYAYWVNSKEGTVNKVPKNAGEVTVIASGQGQPTNIVVDATHVYWTNFDDNEVISAPK